jgi:putative cell wall-binding protein
MKKWSAAVTEHSHAMNLDEGVFTWSDPAKIAGSLKRSAEKSTERKGTVYETAMSMLTFYLNRGGKNIPREQKRVLEQAKEKLKELFEKD